MRTGRRVENVLSSCERELLKNAATRGVRVDGRGILELRNIRISASGPPSSQVAMTVEWGHTKIEARISARIVAPLPERPSDGFLRFHTDTESELSLVSVTQDAVSSLQRLLDKSFKHSRALDTESLCLTPGLQVWSLDVFIHVLDFDGNIVDAGCLAVISALLHFRRPAVEVRGESVVVLGKDERDPVPLSIHHVPVTFTFAFLPVEGDEEFVCVLDPCGKEEAVRSGLMSIAATRHGEICAVEKIGGVTVPPEVLRECMRVATKRASRLVKVVQQTVRKEAEKHANASANTWTTTGDSSEFVPGKKKKRRRDV